jgi:organic hydroperoxide reductase OsmC/OhrA
VEVAATVPASLFAAAVAACYERATS